MKVAAVLPSIEYFSPKRGGALAIWAYQVYKRSAFDVKVIAPVDNDPYATPLSVTCSPSSLIKILREALQNRSAKGLLNPIKTWLRDSYGRKAASICRSWQPDIIHVQNEYWAIHNIKKHNPNSRIILHMQNDHLIEGSDVRRVEQCCCIADSIVFCSEYIRQNALKTFPSLAQKNTAVIFNGADKPKSNHSIRHFNEDPRLLFVGRIVPQKGLHLLLDAIEDVFIRYPKATLRIVGGVRFGCEEDDDYLLSLRKKAMPWGDRITFVGPIPHDKIHAEFSEADLFVCSSVWNEPLGMVNAEAMAAGLPIVAFAKGGIPEVVGDAGILVQDLSSESLARAINAVLSDCSLMENLSQRGLSRAINEFSWEVISEVWNHQLQVVNSLHS